MVVEIIFAIILYVSLITLMYNVIIGVRTKDDKLIVLCGIGAGLIGMMFGVVLASILFNTTPGT
jgi:hypothetical protein